LLSASAIRVCHPGPVAFHRANVSGGMRKEINVRALPVFGRPRGFSILAAAAFPNSSGSTTCALRARVKVSFVQTGFSRPAFSELGLRFIPLHLTSICLAKTYDMGLAGARCEHQHVEPRPDPTQRLKAPLAVVPSCVFNNQCTVPIEFERLLERNPAYSDVPLTLGGVEGNVHSYIVYTYIQERNCPLRKASHKSTRLAVRSSCCFSRNACARVTRTRHPMRSKPLSTEHRPSRPNSRVLIPTSRPRTPSLDTSSLGRAIPEPGYAWT